LKTNDKHTTSPALFTADRTQEQQLRKGQGQKRRPLNSKQSNHLRSRMRSRFESRLLWRREWFERVRAPESDIRDSGSLASPPATVWLSAARNPGSYA